MTEPAQTRTLLGRPLADGDERFRLLVQSVQDYAFFLLDLDGRVASWNLGAERINGYQADEIIGEPLSRFYPEEAVAAGKPDMELRVATAEGRFEDEGWRLRKDGTRFWASVVVTAVRDRDGSLIGFAKVVRDLTERRLGETELRNANAELSRRAEELTALNRQLQTFELLVTSVVDYAIFVLDPTGRVATWNAGAERIKGYRADEIVGRHFSQFYPLPEIEAGKPDMELRVATAEGRFEEEGWRIRKGGSHFWANVVITALRDDSGRLVGFAKVTRDLTERRRTEEERAALLAREQAARVQAEAARRLGFMAEASRVLAGSLDFHTTLQRVAQLAVPDLADWCVVDMLGPDGRLERLATAHVDPARAEASRDLDRRYPSQPLDPAGPAAVVRTGQSELQPVVSDALLASMARDAAHLRDLRELGVRSYVSVPLEAHGQRLGALTLLRAQSERPYEPADLELAEDLAHRAAIAVENARLVRDAQEAVRARDEFLAIASHELKTPLTPLLLHVQTLLRSLRKGTFAKVPTDQISTALEACERQIKRFRMLIEELLDLSRITGGRLTLELEEVDLAELVRTLVGRYEAELARAGSSATLALERPTMGRWDRLRLEQVVTNLLSNAIKYGERRPIEVRCSVDGEFAELIVRDHGIGIASEDHARIFERFERAVSARHYGGLGMGLYITRQIVEAHGGTIRVASEGPGQGSTFVVRLPVAQSSEHRAA